MKFVRTIQKITEFPTTRRSQSSKLKAVLLAIGLEAQRSTQAADEAKVLCEAFLAQFKDEATPVPTPDEPHKYTQEELEEMHYTAVDKIAEELGVSTEGNKAETIVAILSVQA